MTETSLITEEMRKAIGYETEPITIEIDKTLLKRFVDGVDDPNTLWQDEDAARFGRYRGLVAPPSLLCAALFAGKAPTAPLAGLLPCRFLDGGAEWEVFQPIRLGDSITASNRLSDLSERKGRVGPMLILTFESTFLNQHAEVVGKSKSTVIYY